jgi:hypothetical protein
LLISVAAISAPVLGQVSVANPWVRSTVPGQAVAGAYMEIRSASAVNLVKASSPAAKTTEIHEMRMEGNIMKMREVARIEVPAGRTVQLKPGGYHVMLIDILKPMSKGDVIPISLVFEQAGKPAQTITVQAAVRDVAAGGGHEMKHGSMQH